MSRHMRQRRGTAAAWTSADPVLVAGEIGLETDTGLFKFGDGVTAWSSLDYAGGGGPVDAADVTVTPAGGISSTDVQAALEELDTEKQPVDADLTSIAALIPTNDDIVQRKAGAWTNRTIAQLASDLGLAASYQPLDGDLTAVAALATNAYGRALLELVNQAALMALLSASTDTVQGIVELATVTEATTGTDTVRAVTPAGLKAAVDAAVANLIASAPGALDTLDELAAALGDDANFAATMTTALAGKQPLDGDLTAISSLTTTTFGRALLELIDAAAGRTALGLGTAATHATGDYDAAGAAAAAQAASQPLDSDLTALAGLAPSNDDFVQRKAGAWTNRTVAQVRADIDTNTVPSTQAFGDAATNGTAATFARGDHKHAMPAMPTPLGLFGDGSDGAVAFDGTNTFAGFATTTGAAPNLVYTLTRDVYATTLSVSAGKIVNTGGFRILATTSVTDAGTIRNNGSAATTNTGGAAAPGGTVGGGGAGANAPASGTTTTAGSNSSNTNAGYHSLGGRGGVGGNANPGTAGTLSTIARMPSFRDLGAALTMCWSPPAAVVTTAPAGPIVAGGGTGGSGGGRTTGATATVGGAGGGGGGGVWIAAPTITNTGGVIQANGGNGADASGAGACVTGGGGGGGGGFVVLIYNTLAAGTEQAVGGTKGAPLNGAAAANDGGNGTVLKIPLA